jgi:hypothetical protein
MDSCPCCNCGELALGQDCPQCRLARLEADNERLRRVLEPFVADNAPAEEEECIGRFWRTIAVSKPQHDRAVAALAGKGTS